MSAPDRDFDRIATAWLDLMPSEAPDRVIESVLQAVDATPQVRRPALRGPWRSPRMNRFLILFAAALLGAVLLGGALLAGSPRTDTPPVPSQGTTYLPTPTPTPLVQIPGLGRGLGYAEAAPADLRSSTWIGEVQPGSSLTPDGGPIRLAFDGSGTNLAVTTKAFGAPYVASTVVGVGPDELGLLTRSRNDACPEGAWGRYTQDPSPVTDVAFRLTARDDLCPERKAALERTWVRALDRPGSGGRGVIVDSFGGAVLEATLPAGTYTTSPVKDAITVEDAAAERALIIVRNPHGYTKTCSGQDGAKMAVGTTAAEFIAYLRTLPGFTVQTEPFEIDGTPATHVTIPSVRTADCPSHVIVEWTTGDPTFAGGWILTQGDTDQLYLVETGGDLYLLQWLGKDMTTAEEQAVLGTVSFRDSLPSLAP